MQKRHIEEHIILIIDEVAIIQNPILKRFLSESRKYNLSLILSGQYFNQINEDIQKAIFANIINYYTFRVSREDAIILSRNMQMEVAVHDSFFAKLKILSELGNRECVLRISTNGKVLPAFKARTLDVISHPRIIEKDGKIVELTKNEFKILHYLVLNKEKIVSRNEIMDYLWESENFIDDNTLTVNIKRLRNKLEEIGLNDVIETKRGQGYILK